jgi:hypothetical protein
VAAVLGRRGDLGLTDAEVRRLEEIDAELARAQAAGASRPKDERGGAGAASGRSDSTIPSPGSMTRAGELPPPPPTAAERRRNAAADREAARAANDPYAAADQLDTAAFFRAEAALRPEVREKAREIAERYREELYDERAAQQKAQRRP